MHPALRDDNFIIGVRNGAEGAQTPTPHEGKDVLGFDLTADTRKPLLPTSGRIIADPHIGGARSFCPDKVHTAEICGNALTHPVVRFMTCVEEPGPYLVLGFGAL
jgi:hypothetical protein